MRLDEAMPLLQAACGVRFGELFAGHPDDLRTNKGHTGQLLTVYVGLQNNCDLCDFEDGELKTNKSSADSQPVETMFITQISKQINTLLSEPPTPFVDSCLYEKIRNLVYLPVVKESEDAADWYYTQCIRVQMPVGSVLFQRCEQDYLAICAGLRAHIEGGDGNIHTTNGPNYIQVRSKDSGSYHPIYSNRYQRYVSDKNYAFYFKKSFMRAALNGTLNC